MDRRQDIEEKEEAGDEGGEEEIEMKSTKELREETPHQTSALIRMKTII